MYTARDTRKSSTLIIWPLLAVVVPALPAVLYILEHTRTIRNPYDGAAIFGLLGIWYSVHALLLSTRIRVVEDVYGYETVVRFSSWMSFTAFFFLLFHVFMREWTGDSLRDFTWFAGQAALLFLALYVFSSKWKTRQPLVHGFLYLSVIAWAIHLTALLPVQSGTRLAISGSAFYAGIGVARFTYFLFLRPLHLRRKGFQISDLKILNERSIEIQISGAPLSYEAGQFSFLRFHTLPGFTGEIPVYLSSSPTESDPAFVLQTVKHMKEQLSGLRIDDPITVDGAYGPILVPPSNDMPLLLIAGGMGVIPFRSMLKYMADSHSMNPVTLLWTVTKKDELVFNDEFLGLLRRLPGLRFIPVIENTLSAAIPNTIADYESGLMDISLVLRLCPNIADRQYRIYLSCRRDLQKTLGRELRQHGVSRKNIIILRSLSD